MTSNVHVYTSAFCGYCARAKALLDQKGVDYVETDLSSDAKERQKLVERTGRRTVPQIFIDGQNIGGCDELFALEARGVLDTLLSGAQGE